MEALAYFLFWAGLTFLLVRFGCGSHVTVRHGNRADKDRRGEQPHAPDLRWIPPEFDVDPVCKRTVRTERAKPSVHDGVVYYFCSRECREIFEAAPDQYVGRSAGAEGQALEHAHV